jgi:hypothetical protein
MYPEALDDYESGGDDDGGGGGGRGGAGNSAATAGGNVTGARMTSWGEVPPHRGGASEIGEVVLFSGVADMQRATDARIDAGDEENPARMGVFTWCWLQQIHNLYPRLNSGEGYGPRREVSYGELLDALKHSVASRLDSVYEGYHCDRQLVKQIPQLSASHAISLYETPFTM